MVLPPDRLLSSRSRVRGALGFAVVSPLACAAVAGLRRRAGRGRIARDGNRTGKAGQRYNEQSAVPVAARTHAEVCQLFAGLDLVEPGVVQVHRWRAGSEDLGSGRDLRRAAVVPYSGSRASSPELSSGHVDRDSSESRVHMHVARTRHHHNEAHASRPATSRTTLHVRGCRAQPPLPVPVRPKATPAAGTGGL
ncbi:MAG TPA: SAM-dependent methyltransferase [Trebonia sp.]